MYTHMKKIHKEEYARLKEEKNKFKLDPAEFSDQGGA